MIEAEESFIDNIHDINKRIESILKTVTTNLLSQYANDINEAYTTSTPKEEQISDEERFKWLHQSFKTLTLAEADEILQQHRPTQAPRERLAKADELFLVQHLDSPVFVIDWPKESKPFYMRQCRHNTNLVNIQKINEMAHQWHKPNSRCADANVFSFRLQI